MTASEDMAERHARQLARYAELSLSLAEDVHAAALAADDPDRKARLASGFHKLGRAMRQSIALEARFVRDRAADQRVAQAGAADARRAAVKLRQDQVRADVERQIWCEVEPRDAPAWVADLNERLDEEALYDDFDAEAVDEHIARLAADLGLTGEGRRGYTPRALRSRVLASGLAAARFTRLFDQMPDDQDGEEDAEDDDDGDGALEDDDEAPGDGPPADGTGASVPEPPPSAEPEAPEPETPDSELEPPDPEPPPPEPPPPEPPPPEPPPAPYIPPWERHPNGLFPGGSGY